MSKVDDYYTIEDSRYTAELLDKEGLLPSSARNYRKLTHLEIVAVLEEHNLRLRHKPKRRVNNNG